MRSLDTEFPGASSVSHGENHGETYGISQPAALREMLGIAAIYLSRPNTSKPAPGHNIYPYLLRGLKIERPNHVWATDISHIPMRRGFVYLSAVVDVASRHVLARRASITGHDFTSVLLDAKIAISMNARASGATMCSSRGCGAAPNIKRSICTPMTACPRRVRRSPNIWPFTMSGARIRASAPAHQTRLILVVERP